MRKKKQLRVNIFFTMIFLIWGACGSVLKAQQVDSFYTDLLRRGEQSYLGGNYEEAIKQFEVAAFGVYGEKNLLAVAKLYLCLCHYALNDIDKCEQYLRIQKHWQERLDWTV